MRLIILASLVLSATAFAANKPATKKYWRKPAAAMEVTCGETADATIKQIEIAPGCFEASQVAEQCSEANDNAVRIVSAAITTCEKTALPKKLPAADIKLREAMNKRCGERWLKETGSMYRSAHAFCLLEVTKFFVGLYDESL